MGNGPGKISVGVSLNADNLESQKCKADNEADLAAPLQPLGQPLARQSEPQNVHPSLPPGCRLYGAPKLIPIKPKLAKHLTAVLVQAACIVERAAEYQDEPVEAMRIALDLVKLAQRICDHPDDATHTDNMLYTVCSHCGRDRTQRFDPPVPQ